MICQLSLRSANYLFIMSVCRCLKHSPSDFYACSKKGPSWPWSNGSWIYNYIYNQCLSPLMLWVRISIRTWCTTLCEDDCQWLATGRWFCLGTPVSSINKTARHDITEILWKSGVTHHNTNQNKNKHKHTFIWLFQHTTEISSCFGRSVRLSRFVQNRAM